MEPNARPSNNPADPSQQPSGQSQNTPAQGSLGGMKVIQPLSTDIKPEAAASQTSAQPTATPTPTTQTAPVQATATAPATPVVAPQPTRPDLSSIYPTVTSGISANAASYSAPSSTGNVEDTPKTATFDEGYAIGSTIFFYQLVAGIVLGLVYYFVLKASSTPLVLAVLYVIEYLVLLYLPYNVLKSSEVEEPLWLSLFGVAAQSIIVFGAFELIGLLIIRAFTDNPTSSVWGSGEAAVPIIYVVFLVASYFLTKLSWGIAFSLFGKIKNKMVVKAIGIGLIAIFVGFIAYHFITLHRIEAGNNLSSSSTTSNQTTGLSRYHVGGNPSFSVDFYKGAKISTNTNGTGDLAYSSGLGVQGVSLSITSATLDATTSCSATGITSEFNFQIQSSNGIVCISKLGTTGQTTSYAGYIQVNGKNYVISMFAFSYQQNLATAKAIFNSIVIS